MSASIDQTFTLRVSGMTCASCVATIERALRSTPGVHSATVNLATEKAQVHGSPELTQDVLADAIKGSGYAVRQAPTAKEEERQDKSETRRLLIVAALTIPLVVIAMGPHVMAWFGGSGMAGMDMGNDMSGMEGMEGMSAEDMANMPGMEGMDMGGDEGDAMATPYPWLQFALATPVVLFGGAPFFRGAWNALRNRHLTMDVLVATGMTTAYGYSAAILFLPALDSGQGVYFETAAVIVMLLLLGRRIEHGAQHRARATLRKLLDSGAAETPTGHMLEDAQVSKIPIQHAVDRVVRYFVPTVLAIAVAASVFWMTLGTGVALDAGFTPSSMALMSLIAVLIIACPCALGLAAPMAVLNGTSRGAESGIIIRGGQAIQASRNIDAVVIKRTGVLTSGAPAVADVIAYGRPEADVLALAGAVEAGSSHPIAIAIHRHAIDKGTVMPPTTSFQGLAGRGARADVASQATLVGRLEWLQEQGVDVARAKSDAKRIRSTGKTATGVAQGGVLLGLIAIEDPVRPSSHDAIRLLKKQGLETILVSGDSPDTAHALATSLGIDRVLSRVLPERQAATIQGLKAEGLRVAVVGDGVQDSAALAEADLAITMGTREGASGIVLTQGDPLAIPASLDLSKATMRKVQQNLAWAFGYNAILIPVAAGLLVAWPLFGMPMRLDPMLAGAAMTLSITSVMLNSLALRKWQPATAVATESHQGGNFPIGSGNPVKA